jgi:hypothetical protein
VTHKKGAGRPIVRTEEIVVVFQSMTTFDQDNF